MGTALRSIRAMAGRLLVVAVLAIVMTTGFVAVDHPSHASAAPNLSACIASVRVGNSWMTYGDLMWSYGYYDAAEEAWRVGNTYLNVCSGPEL
jgi:hypothetical protein